jgi:16S rRNA processing protein RimM
VATPEYVIVGRIRKAHGIRGELVVEPLTDAPDAVFAPGRRVFAGTAGGALAPGAPQLIVRSARAFKGGWLVAFDGIPDRSAAEAWRDRRLLLPESEVEPPGEHEVWLHELLGMLVERRGGEPLGEVLDVYELPQGLALDVGRGGQSRVVLPFTDDVVLEIDRGARRLVVEVPEGLMD